MKTELFEAVYNLANDTYVPINQRTMGATTAKIDRRIEEPRGDTADEILKNVRDDAAELVARADIPDSSKAQVVTQVIYDKMANPYNDKFQAAILDTVISENKKNFFDGLLEDCCAGDFAGFVPEHIIGEKQKKEQDDGNSSCC
jgi:uncharacterized membrane-anchored protein YjiN (DUF445 family)